ncbi:CD226 antigen isoform X2 [Hemitrygon akajei]|uniref:CD226 antigen isoform X2 n=1 Tax=Hemitrygon akajei TaxID=2704970 RepID=UPI003BFA232D
MSRLAHYLLLSTGLFQLQKGVNCKEDLNTDSVIKRQDVVKLKCAHPQTSKLIQLSWHKSVNGKKQNVAIYHPDLGEHIFPSYNRTVKFLSSSINGDITMNASAADEGIYLCCIDTYPNGKLQKTIEVINPANFSSSRVADTYVTLVPKSNMTLFCEYPSGRRVRQVMWKKVSEEEINTIVIFKPPSIFIGYDYKERVQFNNLTNNSLTIQNVMSIDIGRYYCEVITDNGKWSKVFDIGMERGNKMLPVIGAVAFGILFLVLIVGCVWRRSKRKRAKRVLKSKGTERNQQRRANQNSYASSTTSDHRSCRAAENQDTYVNLPHRMQTGRPRTYQ